MSLSQFFDLNWQCFLCLLLLKAFTRRVAEFDGKNYPKACLRGVFSSKVRESEAQKPSKVFIFVFFLKIIATLLIFNF